MKRQTAKAAPITREDHNRPGFSPWLPLPRKDPLTPKHRLPSETRFLAEKPWFFASRESPSNGLPIQVGEDGNVHVNVLKDDLTVERWEEIIPLIVVEMYKLTLSLGGMITGEHGIGATRRKYLPLALDQAQIEIMEKIREVFDPHRILNPAKIFP